VPDNKNHHYVPRFYLKNFSNHGGRTINLFNIKRRISVRNARLRQQCCEAYFYGKTPEIEKIFEDLENTVSRTISNILSTFTVPPRHSKEYAELLIYLIVQHQRTKTAAEECDEVSDQMCKIMLRKDPELDAETLAYLNHVKIVTTNPTAMPMLIAVRIFPLALDLEAKVISNRSNEPFITSDNPVVFYNQYMENFQGASCTGLASLGLQLFLPLSSKIMLHFYDPSVYRIRINDSNVCEISNDAESLKFNELQWFNARENVYYSSQSTPISISCNDS
jgi:hypothetical protein